MKHWLYKSGWRFLPGILAAGVALMTARMGILLPVEHMIYSYLFQVRGEQSWDDRVALIEIDEPSLAAIGQFPWPRHYYTDLLNKLAPANSSVIAFDILFAESTADDAALAEAMANHGNVVLATAWDEQRGVIGPNASFVVGAIVTGHIHYHADTGGITRTYRSKINGISALSIVAVQNYAQNQISTTSDLDQTLWLNWRGNAELAPRYSFIDILNGKVPASTFAKKIVFIGFTGVGLDAMTTPYNQNPPAAGVYQHVVAANNLLAQDHLKPIVWPVWVMISLLSPVLGYWLIHQRLRIYLLANMSIILVWSSVVILTFNHNYWLPTVLPIGNVATTSLLVKLTERLQRKCWLQQQLPNHGQPIPFSPNHPAVEISWNSHQPKLSDYRLPSRLDRCSEFIELKWQDVD